MLLCGVAFVFSLFMVSFSSQAQEAAPVVTPPTAPLQVRLMTWNIRYANKEDEAAGHGWPQRRGRVFELVKANNPDVLCVQEPLDRQMGDLTEALSDYDHYGIGRDDGKRAGEFTGVFYKRERFERIEEQTMWLSVTPDVPSKGWDAVLPRIATRVRLRDKITGTIFDVWGTHFDHVGITARIESARMLNARAASAAVPTVLAGDLNTEPTDPAYPAMVAQGALRDARQISESQPTGSVGTFCGWKQPIKAGGPIDYIFASKDVRVARYDVSTQGFQQLPNLSDHLPIVADLLIPSAPSPQ